MLIQRNDITIQRNEPLFIQLNSDTARELRRELYDEFQGICPVLKVAIPFDKMVLDHKHKRKTDPIGPNGAGLVRGILDYRVNSLEGSILKKFKKSGLYGKFDLSFLLRGIANYIESPLCPQVYIYPSEKPKAPLLKKSDYNLIAKWYMTMFPRSRSIPPYPPKWIRIKIRTINGKKKEVKEYRAKLTTKWEAWLRKAKELQNGR